MQLRPDSLALLSCFTAAKFTLTTSLNSYPCMYISTWSTLCVISQMLLSYQQRNPRRNFLPKLTTRVMQSYLSCLRS